MNHATFRNNGGHSFSPATHNLVEIVTNDDLDNFSIGQAIKDNDGNQYTLIECKHLTGKLYRVILLPVNPS